MELSPNQDLNINDRIQNLDNFSTSSEHLFNKEITRPHCLWGENLQYYIDTGYLSGTKRLIVFSIPVVNHLSYDSGFLFVYGIEKFLNRSKFSCLDYTQWSAYYSQTLVVTAKPLDWIYGIFMVPRCECDLEIKWVLDGSNVRDGFSITIGRFR